MIQVTYKDHMGSDLSVVNAARVSFGKERKALGYTSIGGGPSIPVIHDTDKNLIKYLADHRHMSPFGHAFASFHCRVPLYVHAQLEKHKFLRVNTISRRYVDSTPDIYMPNPFRYKAKDKKQGSTGNANKAVMHDGFDQRLAEHMDQSKELYQEMIDRDIAPELARGWLPQATFTEFIWSGSLDAFSDMCKLRCANDTQLESRMVADEISMKMEELFPVSWESLINSY